MTWPILTARVSNNANVLQDILELYCPPFDWVRDDMFRNHKRLKFRLVADVTFGSGAFWKFPGAGRYNLVPSDIAPKKEWILPADFRALPYRDETFDAVVFDPPYGRMSTSPRKDGIGKCYGLQDCGTPEVVLELYWSGMMEAKRVLKSKGILILKFKDQVNSGKQIRFSRRIGNYGFMQGWEDLDQFVVVQKGTPVMRHKHQVHARKNHSFFWVFRKR